MIPTVIVPILNQPDLLRRMIASIDHPVGRMVVIDNGDVVDPEIGGRPPYPPFPTRVIAPGHNLGVSASWNLGIKATPLSPWWLIVNHDIEFGAGDLARLDAMVEPRGAILYEMVGLAAFVVTPPLLDAVGFFDEGGFHPAYDEDIDFVRRVTLAGLPRITVPFTGTHVGSATIHSDPTYRHFNSRTHPANDRYYAAKWGGEKEGGETFTTPFNRGGHLGDWRLDINRLRDQAWPKSTKEDQ